MIDILKHIGELFFNKDTQQFHLVTERGLVDATDAIKMAELQTKLERAIRQRDEAMQYARHLKKCAQMENADCKCSCGLTKLRNEVKDEQVATN